MVRHIRFFVMDVDGTLTDGKIYMSPSGEAMKAFSIKDGYGIHDELLPNHIIPIIITGRVSDIVSNRAKELGILEVYQGVTNKLKQLEEVVFAHGFSLDSVAYIGDDLNDMECMVAVKESHGLVGCPADASTGVLNYCDFVSKKNGGEGAVREFIDFVLNSQNQM